MSRLSGKATWSSTEDKRTEIDYSKIKLLGKQSVLFVWVDEIEDKEMTTASGIILQVTLSKDKPRWGLVVKTTTDSGVRVGEYILPLKCKDPFGCVIGGLEHWTTEDNEIQLVTDARAVCDSIMDV
jgi:hypothetical protein